MCPLGNITVNIYNVIEYAEYCIGIWEDIYCKNALGIASPEWVQTLIDLHAEHFKKSIFLVVEENGSPIGITFFGKNLIYRNGFIFSNTWNMNASGCDVIDLLWIEHNDICCHESRREIVAKMVIQALIELPNWDEVSFPGVSDVSVLSKSLKDVSGVSTKLIVANRHPNYVIDLRKLRESGTDYLTTLGKNTRYKIRRSIKKFEGIGSVSVSEAGSEAEGLAWMEKMKQFSIARMKNMKRISSFENEGFSRFHEEYFRKSFPLGRVLLQKFTAGEITIGYHYNILSNGRLYFYQCGYDYDRVGDLNPGIFCHYQNITWAASKGLLMYDFMPGDADYKKDLSNGEISEHVEWLILRRPRVRFAIEDSCRNIRDALRKMIFRKS